ncbi:hypothetical protein M9Y10_044154 [Tritrichomonas musculus]|uniref:Uncharacterized protein n=1 Tax=Tritrichomonas musculus TaxID=1915356 RepID=A0ABR2K1N1_9EUKA
MSIPLDQLLLSWINWYVPDGGDLESLADARKSPKLQKAYEKLFPVELCPQPEDPLEYAYTAIACYIKSFNHGPDKFTPPSFSETDELRNMKTLIMNLFLLFKIVENDKEHFPDGNQPDWYVQLSEKFQKWDKIQSTSTEFHLPILIATTKSQISQKNEEVQAKRADLQKLENDIQSKIEHKKETFSIILANQTEELTAAEEKKKKLLMEQEKLESEQLKLHRKSEENQKLQDQINELQKEKENLTAELERLKEEEKEIAQIKIDLTGMEQIDLNNRCEEETKKKADLEAEEKELLSKLEKEIDYTERDQLLAEINELQRKVEVTNPEKIITKWNAGLDAEIQKAQQAIEKLRGMISIGNEFFGE